MTSLTEPEEANCRRALLESPHMRPLRPVLDALRARRPEVPDPDPLDGGAAARLLLLLETPGPRVRATGFVSLDNPSGTSRNLLGLLAGAGVARRDVLIWNAVPWIIHDPGAANRAPRRAEIRDGIACLPALLPVLPWLKVVVLAGRIAAEAEPILRAARPDLPILRMPHPSPTIQCTSRAIPARSRATLAEAGALLSEAFVRDRAALPSPGCLRSKPGGPSRPEGPPGVGVVCARTTSLERTPPPPRSRFARVRPPRKGEGEGRLGRRHDAATAPEEA